MSRRRLGGHPLLKQIKTLRATMQVPTIITTLPVLCQPSVRVKKYSFVGD